MRGSSVEAVEMTEFRTRVEEVLTASTLTYDQRLRRLAGLAVSAMPYPTLSQACREALDKRVICDMFEGNRPFAPRYVLPDYATLLRNGSAHLELEPPHTLAEALSVLTIAYGHVPSVTTYPVYLGDLDTLLEPFVADVSDDELDAALRLFWIQLDRLLPDAFVHTDLGPRDGRVLRSILRVERSLRQIVPNITLRVDPDLTPDSVIEAGVRTVFETGKPHFVNHPMMVGDHGPAYASVSCYNSLKVGGGAHTLVRLNLKEAARRHTGGLESFLATTLPVFVELTAELIEARVRSLVEDQEYFAHSWLVDEGLIARERFSAMFGIFGLAEAIELLLAQDAVAGRYGHDEVANRAAWRLVERVAELVAARELPYCEGGRGRAYLHSQSGIDLDVGTTAGTRIPVGDEPPMLEHILACAPNHRHFASGVSDIFHVDDTALGNPQAVVDIIRGAFTVGMRDFTFNVDSNEFIRITGYLVRKSDLVGIEEHGARHGSDFLAAGALSACDLTQRAVKRVAAAELSAGG